MRIFIPILWMFLAVGFVSAVTRRRFGYVLPPVLMSVPAVLFLSQFLCGSFTPGVALLLLPAAAFVPVAVSRRGREFVFSSGFFALLAAVCIFFVLDFKRPLTRYDELMHWGMMVKEMFRLDRFYCVPESNLMIHKDYPPFAALLELFWCRLMGQYSEMGITMAANIFTLSVVLGPLSELLTDRGGLFGLELFRALALLLFFFLFDGLHVFMSVYTDMMIAAVFSYAFFLVFSGKVFSGTPGSGKRSVVLPAAAFSFALFSLLQLREVGIGLFVLVCFYYLLETARRAVQVPEAVAVLCVSAGIPAAALLLWKKYTAGFQVVRQFEAAFASPAKLLAVVRGSVEGSAGGLQHDTLIRFILETVQANISNTFVPVTFVSALLICYIAILLMKLRAGQAASLALVFTCGSGGYALMILLAYLFGMEPREMQEFNQFTRYMGTYVSAEMLSLLFVFVTIHRGTIAQRMKTRQYLLLFLVLAVIAPADLLYLIPQKLHGNPRFPYRQHAERLEAAVEPGARVFLVADSTSNDYQVFIAYYANALRIADREIEAGRFDYAADDSLRARVARAMSENDYVYVIRANDAFRTAFADVAEGNAPADGTIYKVVKEAGNGGEVPGFRLAAVETAGK